MAPSPTVMATLQRNESERMDEIQSDYPRPDWQRPRNISKSGGPALGWQSLNRVWSFAFDESDVGLEREWYRGHAADKSLFPLDIRVPFAFQTKASGIGERRASDVVWYALEVDPSPGLLPSGEIACQVLLHFGAVDYEATVWSGGIQLGQHRGGHMPFSLDVTTQIRSAQSQGGKFNVVVRVQDKIQDLDQPRGKQYWRPKSESIFYTPTTGIWQSVWLERVPRLRIERAIMTPDIDRGTLTIDAQLHGTTTRSQALRVDVRLGQLQVASTSKPLHAGAARVTLTVDMALSGTAPPEDALQQSLEDVALSNSSIVPHAISGETWQDGIALWTPERPALYDVTLSIVDQVSGSVAVDVVDTYTGMRKVSTDGGIFRINNKPYFQRLVLDQGYWPETGMTPPSSAALRKDIEAMKAIGLNGARKHQKVEDPRYLYWADKLGFLVWGEMANAYQFSPSYIERFTDEWTAAVRRDINHPCIVVWTPVNESWAHPSIAQQPAQASFLKAMYHLTKAIDPSRPVVDNDGWEHVETDLLTVHDYSGGSDLSRASATAEKLLSRKAGKDVVVGPRVYKGQPFILSEFGGIAYDPDALKKHGKAGGSEDWGYQTAQGEQDYLRALVDVVAVCEHRVVQGFCYTQLADVEQEVNGILTADRRHKVSVDKLRAIFGREVAFDSDRDASVA
ncbi:unnamed protein product [Parajaminaea phylloscopi]